MHRRGKKQGQLNQKNRGKGEKVVKGGGFEKNIINEQITLSTDQLVLNIRTRYVLTSSHYESVVDELLIYCAAQAQHCCSPDSCCLCLIVCITSRNDIGSP
jgi:hypothetical protein